jgi:hypothetical protein
MTESEWLASDDPGAMLQHLGSSASPRKLRLFAVACCRTPEVYSRLTDDSPCDACGARGFWYGVNVPASRCHACGGTGRINRSRRAVEVAERFADGLVTEEELAVAYGRNNEGPTTPEFDMVRWASFSPLGFDVEFILPYADAAGLLKATQAALLREVFGNPYRRVGKVILGPDAPVGEDVILTGNNAVPTSWLTSTVVSLAHAIYEEQDFDRMPILGDALEEAGCTDEAVLRHCRGEEEWTEGELGYVKRDGANLWRPLRGPHVRGCLVVDVILRKE